MSCLSHSGKKAIWKVIERNGKRRQEYKRREERENKKEKRRKNKKKWRTVLLVVCVEDLREIEVGRVNARVVDEVNLNSAYRDGC